MQTAYCPFTATTRLRLSRSSKAVLMGLLISVLATVPAAAIDVLVGLQNGTATFSQTCGGFLLPDKAVDGEFNDVPPGQVSNGWAIAATCNTPGDDTTNQTAVWETDTNLGAGSLTFSMHFNHFNPGTLLGRFRFSVTTDNRATFADGLDTGGDVYANWSVLMNPIVSGPAGMTFTTLADQSILAGGSIAAQATYTVSYTTAISGITGVRLEALEDPSLPFNGPGLHPLNGNFDLTEMTLTIAPTLGGVVTGMSPSTGSATCLNLTTLKSVRVPIPAGVRSWDCEQAGLVVHPGDTIYQTMTVTGPTD